MKYKDFKHRIKELGLGLKAKSCLKWGNIFEIRVVNDDNESFAHIRKYEVSNFNINTDVLYMTDKAEDRVALANLVIEFANTLVAEREYGPEVWEPRYLIHLGDDMNLVHYCDADIKAPSFAADQDAEVRLLLWSEVNVAKAMKLMPNLNWDKCLIDKGSKHGNRRKH